jgi:hypothetical protein
MQFWYIIITLLAAGAAGVAGGVLGWLGALAVGLVTRWERRMPTLTSLADDRDSHAALPR